MASPFAVFRRNQKLLLAIVAIGAMVAFVFLDPLMRYLGGSGRGRVENPVVVTTKFGDFTERDLMGLLAQRQMVENFLKNAAFETIEAQIKEGVIDPRMQMRAVEEWYMNWKQQLLDRSQPGPEQSAIETYVLARKAQEMGMVVSDQAINDLIKEITLNSVPRETIAALIASSQPNRRTSVKTLFDALRTEILASKLIQSFALSLRDVPPAQRFEYFLRLSRRADAEVVPLSVADFVAQVDDPPAGELTAFYDKYKDRFPDPNSPEPGFKQPKQAAFQYFKADFAKFKDEMKGQVTEEEIAAYYEKNKNQFRVFDLPGESADKKAEEDTKDEGSKETDETKAKETTDEVRPAEGTPPASSDPASEKPASVEQPAPPAGDSQPSPTGESDQSSNVDRLRSAIAVGMTGLLLAQDPESAAQPPATPPTAPAGEGQTPPTGDPPTENKPADVTPPTSPSAALDFGDTPQEDTPRFEPLEKVRDTILDTLAAQKAREKINTIFEELSAEMRRYSDERDVYNAKAKGTAGTPPRPLAFAELAEKHKIEAKELPLVTASDAVAEDIGKVSRIVEDRRSQFGFRSEPFAEFAFSDSLILYKPTIVEDNDGNEFLFWKTEEEAAYVPTLDAIKDKVTHAWKLTKARDLAKKRAEEYAEQARAAGKPLAEIFKDHASLKVSDTGYFSWLTSGNVPFDPFSSQPRLNEVPEVDRAGNEFMEKAFALSPGQSTVAINQPQNTVYLVQLKDYERSLEELRGDFAREPAMRYLPVAITDHRKVYLDWLSDLNAEAKVHWNRQADKGDRLAMPGPMRPEDMDF